MILKKILLSTLFLGFIFSCSNSFAQETEAIIESVYSEVLDETRVLRVHLPMEYSPDSTYDVLYATDGEWNTPYIDYIRNFAVIEGFMPEIILVGIENIYIDSVNQRRRDFLLNKYPVETQTGNTDAFTSFLSDEVIPFIENKYPTSGKRILYGHSLGGLYAGHIFLEQPDLFDGYMALDPAFWWGGRELMERTSKVLPQKTYSDVFFWVAGLTQSADGMGIIEMDSIITSINPNGVRWKSVNYPDETHISIRLKGIYDGLKFLYSDVSFERR